MVQERALGVVLSVGRKAWRKGKKENRHCRPGGEDCSNGVGE